MRRLFLFTIAVVVVARPLNAQISGVRPCNHGPELDHRHVKEYLLETQREQHGQLRRMASGSAPLPIFDKLRRARYSPLAYARW